MVLAPKKLPLSLLVLITCTTAYASDPCDPAQQLQPSVLCAANQAIGLDAQVQTLTGNATIGCEGNKSTVPLAQTQALHRAAWTYNFQHMDEHRFAQDVQPNLPVPADEGIEVISKPDPNDPDKQLIEPNYIDGQERRPVLNDRLEKLSISIPANTPVVVADSKEEVRANPNAFVLFFNQTDKILSLGIGAKLSVALGATKAQEWSSGTWWQEGLRHDPHFLSPSYDVQYAIPAKSMIFLSKVHSGLLKKVVDNTYFDFAYTYVGSFGDDALATGSGISNPYHSPVYEWVGKGYEHGVTANIHVNLPYGLYVAAGPMWTRNHYKMHIEQVGNCPAGMQCPSINETVEDPAKLNYSSKGSITVGWQINERSSFECSRVMADDLGWYGFSANEQYPAGWYKYSYTCKVRVQI